ncbi:UDP-3-O-(3-hydroxymyristoyl)glucosamine N-acyltransferase [Pseudooceanicola sp. LIPI14-2-Ac024]|uniref:UDP-3-O-(3-hydroxymyristoyl)glucosamine N-acyltransferase n=1 Tax=Pseudooceanicola sp. LIPI14-2-Ac024 TaxID=3344875 RepID=UPI0035CF88EB
MPHSISEIAAALGAEVAGDTGLTVTGVAEPAGAGPEDLALALKPEFAEGLAKGEARAAMLWPGADWQGLGLKAAIFAPRGRLAMAGLTRMLDPGQGYYSGIHPSAYVDPSAELDLGVSVAPQAVIGAGARIGARSVIGPGVYVGTDAVIGENAILHAHVRIGARARIGKRFIAQPGATIGFDGTSFVTEEASNVEQARSSAAQVSEAKAQEWVRIHSLGGVVIGDDVELGANTCVDAGTIRPTRVGNGTKIDNLCMVGHNVVIGDHCFFASMVGIAGSTRVGNHVVLGGQVGVSDNITIGDNVVAGGGSGIVGNVPAGRFIMGYPAVKMETHLEMYKAQRRLPRLMNQVSELQNAVFKGSDTD